MGYKAAVGVLKQADDLKLKVNRKCDLLNSNEAWTDQQKLQTIYHQALVLDLEYALDKKVEQDLWNIGFKIHISSLQELTRDKKNPKRSDAQALLTWCLEAASGFYLTLLQDLCNTFNIDLPFRRKGSVFGQINITGEHINLPQTSSCLYICQYCLVHLGDIARYRNQRKQAENFYKQAILVSPTSGQPYNQLALLEASQGDKLSTVYYYVRGITVKNPFPAAITNLMNTLSSAVDKESPCEKIQTKMTVNEFIQVFLCTHGYLHTALDLNQADLCIKSLNTTMTALVATQSFSKDFLIKITIINLYALSHVLGSKSINKTDELTEDEKKVVALTLELIAGSLSAFLVPVHTLVMDDSLLDYYALPAVKLLMNFIQNDPEVLKSKVFGNRLQIWPSLCKLLNSIQKKLKALNYNKYMKAPLSEDKNLQGFLPFAENYKDLNFKEDIEEPKIERLVRLKRIVEFSKWLTELDINGSKLITKNEVKGELVFEPGCTQPDPTKDLLEEMKSFTIEVTESNKKSGLEKKAGILKPQGSLEKSREERELNNDSMDFSSGVVGGPKGDLKIKRGKQNVALQSIFKKMEENKQVKFNVEEPEKLVKFEAKPLPKPQQNPQPTSQNNQFNLPLRTQSFNQNHPAFPITQQQPQPDFLTSLRNVPNIDKGTNYQYPKTDANNQLMMPFGNIQPNMSLKPNKPPVGYPKAFVNPQIPPPYQNVQNLPFPPSFNPPPPPKRDDQNAWWQNNFPPRPYENYPVNYAGYQFGPPPPDFSKPPPSGPRQGAGDIFGSSCWGGNFPQDNSCNFGGGSRGVSMRQAMLKEANLPGSSAARYPCSPPSPPIEQFRLKHAPPPTPGYSLFNTTSWNPTLPGQLKNSKLSADNANNQISQQSLFTGHGPQSLAQLLEQQNQIPRNDL
ncbi:unnamed protein product [Brassicogethes aeneus]|uniref:Protein SMG7 n=1 Tax=Brassicogethes aeneus TaxID=1431903 RepID=A0A9P0BD12_BRAAE|nr:unnamed protein product [Brassicogethes aeneus]